MSNNFVFDGEALPGTKVNSRPLLGPANTIVPASEFNELTKALADIRTLLLFLLDPSSLNAVTPFFAVSAAGRNMITLNDPLRGNQLTYCFVDENGAFKTSLNPPP